MSGCDTQMNGGDGQCVPPGTCSPGYILVMNQCQPEILTAHVHILVDNTYGRLRRVVFGADGALYVTTSNGTNDKILRITASQP